MSLSETRKAIRELPNNLIYVDAAGSVQAADLKELEAAYGDLDMVASAIIELAAILRSRKDPPSARATPSGQGLSESGS